MKSRSDFITRTARIVPTLRCGFALCLAASATPVLSAATSFPERKTLTMGEYSIQYTVGDEDLARAFLTRLRELPPRAAPRPIPQPPLPLDALKSEKPSLLAAICRYLALKGPDAAMDKAFDEQVQLQIELRALVEKMAAAKPRRFQLWRSPDLKARLDAGESIPGMVRTPDGFRFNLDTTDLADLSTLAWPVPITSRDTETGEALVSRKVGEVPAIGDLYQSMIAAIPGHGVFLVIHEITEMTIISHHLKSKDRRWYCDGVANYIAWKVIEERVGPDAARLYYDLQADLAQYSDVKGRIDLVRWPAVEDQGKLDESGKRLNAASYAFATEVIARVCAKHGADLLPRLFAEIDRTPYERRTIKTVFRAFKKLTGEDLRSYLPARS